MVKKIYRSAKGEIIDFDLLLRTHKTSVAVGNARMNANGDRLGAGGKITQYVENIPAHLRPDPNAAYNTTNPNAVKMVSLKDNIDDLSKHASAPNSAAKNTDPSAAKTPAEIIENINDQNDKKRKIIDSQT